MSSVRLHARPRRVPCAGSCTPPPFQFSAATAAEEAKARSAGPAALRWARRVVVTPARVVGRTIDLVALVALIAMWCAVHIGVWSFAFELGDTATCWGVGCPAWLTERILLACAVLAAATLALAIGARRARMRATGMLLLVLLTFDIAALMLLGVQALTS